MGMIFQKAYTMPLPPGAEITVRDGRRIARWRLKNGDLRTAEVIEGKDGKLPARGKTKAYSARYRDGSGEIVETATGCADKVAARAVLTKLERKAELVRAGVMTPAEGNAADHAGQPLSKHIAAYECHLRTKGCNARRISMVRRRLERLARECRFATLNRMFADPFERWLVKQADAGMSAATRNTYRESAVCFGNWCRRTNRVTQNPFADVSRADQNVDHRHQRRALTADEIMRLLKVARLRPLAEYGRDVIHKCGDGKSSPQSRATWKRAPLTVDNFEKAVERGRDALKGNPDLIEKIERTGEERALVYKTLALTGLRKGELASLTVAQLELDEPIAYAILNPADEKNRKGSTIPLRSDLAAELSSWLAQCLDHLHDDARKCGKPIPVRLPPNTPLFKIPTGITRIFDRDLAAAGIPKRDDRNRVVDIHALRVTFATHLCAAGVPLRTAQAAMRHSKPELTANIYTDPRLLDVAGAIDSLPELPLPPETATDRGPETRRRATV